MTLRTITLVGLSLTILACSDDSPGLDGGSPPADATASDAATADGSTAADAGAPADASTTPDAGNPPCATPTSLCATPGDCNLPGVLEAVTLSGRIQPRPDVAEACDVAYDWSVALSDVMTGERFEISFDRASPPSTEAVVPAGRFDVTAAQLCSGMSPIPVASPLDPTDGIDVEVPIHLVEGDFTVAGQPYRGRTRCDVIFGQSHVAELVLQDPRTGATVEVAAHVDPQTGRYRAGLPSGTWDVLARLRDCRDGINDASLLDPQLVAQGFTAGTAGLDVALQAVTATVTLQWDGVEGECVGLGNDSALKLRFVDLDNGRELRAAINPTRDASQVFLRPGRYDIYMRRSCDFETAVEVLGARDVRVDDGARIDLVAPLVRLSGSVDVDGRAPEDTCAPGGLDWGLWLTPTAGDGFVQRYFAGGARSYEATIPEGVYDVGIQLGGLLPGPVCEADGYRGFRTVARAVTVSGDTTLDLVLDRHSFWGTVNLINGPNLANCGRLILRDTSTGHEMSAFAFDDDGFRHSFPEGTYDVYVDASRCLVEPDPGPTPILLPLPGYFEGAVLVAESVTIDQPRSLDVERKFVTLRGPQARLSGRPMPASDRCSPIFIGNQPFNLNSEWSLELVNEREQLHFPMQADGTETFEVLVPEGDYRISAALGGCLFEQRWPASGARELAACARLE